MNGDKPRICEKCGGTFHGDEPCVLSHVDLSDRGWLQRADREINDLALNTLRLYGISDEDEIQRLYSLDLNMQLFSIVLALESEATMKGGGKRGVSRQSNS